MRLDQFAGLARVRAATPEVPGLVLHRDRRDHDLVPVLLRLHVAGQVIVMEPLHHADDRALLWVVEAGRDRVVVAVLDTTGRQSKKARRYQSELTTRLNSIA
jgi:hypothetical protein